MKKPRHDSYSIFALAEEWKKFNISETDIWGYLDGGHLSAVLRHNAGSPVEIKDFSRRRDLTLNLLGNPEKIDLAECKLVQDGKTFQLSPRESTRFNSSDLSILLNEIERFERLHSGDPAGKQPEPAPGIKQTVSGELLPGNFNQNQAASESEDTTVTTGTGFSGPVRKGKAYTPEGKFMDGLLNEYRTKHMQESEDFKVLTTFITTGMKSKPDKWEVMAIDKDSVSIKLKRTPTVFTMNKLEKLWEERKKRNPFKANQ